MGCGTRLYPEWRAQPEEPPTIARPACKHLPPAEEQVSHGPEDGDGDEERSFNDEGGGNAGLVDRT